MSDWCPENDGAWRAERAAMAKAVEDKTAYMNGWNAAIEAIKASIDQIEGGFHDGISGDWHQFSVEDKYWMLTEAIRIIHDASEKEEQP